MPPTPLGRMHATDAGCNKCKKCGKSEKYEKCDNFETLRNPPRAAAACREFLGGSRFDPPSRGTKFSTISGRVASFLAVL